MRLVHLPQRRQPVFQPGATERLGQQGLNQAHQQGRLEHTTPAPGPRPDQQATGCSAQADQSQRVLFRQRRQARLDALRQQRDDAIQRLLLPPGPRQGHQEAGRWHSLQIGQAVCQLGIASGPITQALLQAGARQCQASQGR